MRAVLVLVLLVSPAAHPAANVARRTPDKPKILIVNPKSSGVVRGGDAASANLRLEAAIRREFPCAEVITANDIMLMARFSKDMRLLTAADAGDVMDDLAGALGADLVIQFSLSTTGTTHDDPSRTLVTTVLDMRQNKAVHKGTASGEGWDWSKSDVMDETIDDMVAGMPDLCPWVGTVTYERIVDLDSTTTTASGDEVHTIRNQEKSRDTWTFTLSHKARKPVKITTSGAGSTNTLYESHVYRKNVTCLKMNAAGEVRDDNMVSGVNQELVTHRDFSGEASDSLTNMQFQLRPDDAPRGKQLWSISAIGGAMGKGVGHEYDEMKGGCGTKTGSREPIPGPHISAFLFGVQDLKNVDGVITTTVTLPPSLPGVTEKVTVALHKN